MLRRHHPRSTVDPEWCGGDGGVGGKLALELGLGLEVRFGFRG